MWRLLCLKAGRPEPRAGAPRLELSDHLQVRHVSNPLRDFLRSPLAASGVVRELLIAAICAVAGVLVMPCLIFACGRLALGPYAHGNLFALWRDFLVGLGTGSEVSWFIVVGPYVLLWLLRGVRRLLHNQSAPQI
jgi:hypothetical protein